MNVIKFLVVAAVCCGLTLSDDDVELKDKKTSSTVTTAQTAVIAEMTNASANTSPTGTSVATTVAPPSDIWTASYNGTNIICILLSANITLTYNSSNELKSVTIPPPVNGSDANGVCGSTKQSITIVYSQWSVTFNFIMDNSSNTYQMNSFQVTYTTDNINVTQNVSDFWSGGMDKVYSYRCNTTESLYDNDSGQLTKLTMSDMQLEAFQNKTKVEFSSDVSECKDDRAISNLVPIIVGAALGGLILIVLIAYLIGRRRSRRGYEQV